MHASTPPLVGNDEAGAEAEVPLVAVVEGLVEVEELEDEVDDELTDVPAPVVPGAPEVLGLGEPLAPDGERVAATPPPPQAPSARPQASSTPRRAVPLVRGKPRRKPVIG